jgi:hypothetical protein
MALTLSANDARLLQLALRALRSERKRAPEMAAALCEESRTPFLAAMAADAEACKILHGRIDDLLNIRRRLTPERAAITGGLVDAYMDAATLPDTPATGMDVIDCTGVIKGNADLESTWGRKP